MKSVPLSPDFVKGALEGLLVGLVILGLFIGWASLRMDRTMEKLQAQIPFKTTAITLEHKKPETPTPKEQPKELTLAESKQASPLPPAPLEGLTEPFENTLLPLSRASDDLTPFKAYKRPFIPTSGKARVAIGIVDYGLSSLMSQSALDNLPQNVTLILSPYAPEPETWAKKARAYGHEFWLGLPMQSADIDVNPPGPQTLLTGASIEDNQARLFSVMGRVTGYVGLVSEKNHGFGQGDIDSQSVMKQIFGRGLAFAESNPEIQAYGLPMALEFGYPYTQNHFWLDTTLRPESIRQTLKELELLALKKGKAIAFVHPYPIAIRELQDWMAHAPEKGIQIAPLSAMIDPEQP